MTLALIAAGLVMMLAAHQSGQENSWRPMAYWGRSPAGACSAPGWRNSSLRISGELVQLLELDISRTCSPGVLRIPALTT